MKQKNFILKAYQEPWQLKEAINIIKDGDSKNSQLSILVKFLPENDIEEELTFEKALLQKYCISLLGDNIDFGFFSNHEIGNLFIAGPLSSIFLYKVVDKPLGEMSGAIYGIFRGFGISQGGVDASIHDLNNHNYLLAIRGYNYELKSIEYSLKKMINI